MFNIAVVGASNFGCSASKGVRISGHPCKGVPKLGIPLRWEVQDTPQINSVIFCYSYTNLRKGECGMDQLKVFNFLGTDIRIVMKDGEPWWIAKDVCDVLDIGNSRQALTRLDADEKGVISNDTLGGEQQMQAVNESGLYSLIIGSRKPEAKQFKRWITHEVLPTIRKTGGYVANDDLFISTYLPHADEQTKLIFKATLETVRKANEQIVIMKPKVEYFDALVESNLLTNFRETAKELHTRERTFIHWLQEQGYIYRDAKGKLQPYAAHVPKLFEMKEWERNGQSGVRALITPKGRETFRLLLTMKAG